MFGRSKPRPFKPYTLRGGKPERRMPRWLLWLSTGTVLGVAAVIVVQQNYLPQRLSPQESAQLTTELRRAQASLQETRAMLETANNELAASKTRVASLVTELAAAQHALSPLQEDVKLLQEVLPPDPRGGNLQIRAGRFFNQQQELAYHLVLTRNDGGVFKGNVQFTVEGRLPNGRTTSVDLNPIGVAIDNYQNLHGSVALPEGMHARQITVRVLDGKNSVQAMRIINSRS